MLVLKDVVLIDDIPDDWDVEFGRAGVLVSAYQIVYYDPTDDTWNLAKADTTATSGPVKVGMALTDAILGAAFMVLKKGIIQKTAWGLTAGVAYVSETTAGAMQHTATSTTNHVARVLGHVSSDGTEMDFRPSNSWVVQ